MGGLPQSILITGASGKLGRRLTCHFLAQGVTVIAVGRREEALADLAAVVDENAAARLWTLAVDLAAPTAPMKLMQYLDAQSLCPAALVNNARSLDNLAVDKNGHTPRDAFMGELLLGTVVPYELSMALAGQAGGKLATIVNVGSMYGVVAVNPALYDDPAHQSPIQYSVAKAALIHLTRELAVRLADKGIRVNAVSFGGVAGRVDEVFKTRYGGLCPMRRMLTEDEIVGPVEFLLSPASAGMTGHNLLVDGGWSAW